MRHSVMVLVVLTSLRLAAGSVEEMTVCAGNLLAALTPEQKTKAVFQWTDAERFNWHFIPKERKGLTLKDMSSAQKHLAYGLMSTSLGARGFQKATTIMSLEQVLQDIEGPQRRFPRDPELYHFSIFGLPSTNGTWGWRVEGHHLSFNHTIIDGHLAAGTPSFLGANPAEIRSGPRAGLRVLGAEEDLARQLVLSLTDEQRKSAIVDTKAPDDILTVANRKALLQDDRGLEISKMISSQQLIVDKILAEYVGRLRGNLADPVLLRIGRQSGEKLVFAWAGGTKKGDKHYYRIKGSSFLLEYDNTQNDGNHVHAVWRDLNNDFGEDVLAAHLKAEHGK
ncbi:MAG: DUF3500 domain-containing protein [Pedosphaera sp.]|nr:DUF3500 domain-containing protein [Pedosphaera sp.]